MQRVMRITNVARLASSNPFDTTRYYTEATHIHLCFAEYKVLQGGIWEEARTWTTTVRIDDLANLLDEADLLEEITPSKQSGGNTDE
jgi:hypothetical protein